MAFDDDADANAEVRWCYEQAIAAAEAGSRSAARVVEQAEVAIRAARLAAAYAIGLAAIAVVFALAVVVYVYFL